MVATLIKNKTEIRNIYRNLILLSTIHMQHDTDETLKKPEAVIFITRSIFKTFSQSSFLLPPTPVIILFRPNFIVLRKNGYKYLCVIKIYLKIRGAEIIKFKYNYNISRFR